jgi:hypothetical protein
MAKGIFQKQTAAITSATTTALIAAGTGAGQVAPGETAYVKFIGVDVSAAGTTFLATIQPTTTVAAFNQNYNLSAIGAGVGHAESRPSTPSNDRVQMPGWALPVGEGLQVVTTGTPGSATVAVIYEIK